MRNRRAIAGGAWANVSFRRTLTHIKKTSRENTRRRLMLDGAEDGIRTRDPRLGKAMLYP
jgi:hypothetical protein